MSFLRLYPGSLAALNDQGIWSPCIPVRSMEEIARAAVFGCRVWNAWKCNGPPQCIDTKMQGIEEFQYARAIHKLPAVEGLIGSFPTTRGYGYTKKDKTHELYPVLKEVARLVTASMQPKWTALSNFVKKFHPAQNASLVQDTMDVYLGCFLLCVHSDESFFRLSFPAIGSSSPLTALPIEIPDVVFSSDNLIDRMMACVVLLFLPFAVYLSVTSWSQTSLPVPSYTGKFSQYIIRTSGDLSKVARDHPVYWTPFWSFCKCFVALSHESLQSFYRLIHLNDFKKKDGFKPKWLEEAVQSWKSPNKKIVRAFVDEALFFAFTKVKLDSAVIPLYPTQAFFDLKAVYLPAAWDAEALKTQQIVKPPPVLNLDVPPACLDPILDFTGMLRHDAVDDDIKEMFERANAAPFVLPDLSIHAPDDIEKENDAPLLKYRKLV